MMGVDEEATPPDVGNPNVFRTYKGLYKVPLGAGIQAFGYDEEPKDYMVVGLTCTNELQFFNNLFASDASALAPEQSAFTLPSELAPKTRSTIIVPYATVATPGGAWTDSAIGALNLLPTGECRFIRISAIDVNEVMLAGVCVNVAGKHYHDVL